MCWEGCERGWCVVLCCGGVGCGLCFGVGDIVCDLFEFARMFGRCQWRRDTLYVICTQYMNRHGCTSVNSYYPQHPHITWVVPATWTPWYGIVNKKSMRSDRPTTYAQFYDAWSNDSRCSAASRTSISMPTCPTTCNPIISPPTLTGILTAGKPARLAGTVNTSLTYPSTGVICEIVSKAGAGPTVVGHNMTSHFSPPAGDVASAGSAVWWD